MKQSVCYSTWMELSVNSLIHTVLEAGNEISRKKEFQMNNLKMKLDANC